MSTCLLRSSQVFLPQLRACHQLWPLLFSHLLRIVCAEPPQLGLRKCAAGRGKGLSMQHTQLFWECGWYPLTPSLFFPPLSSEELGCPPQLMFTPSFGHFSSNSLPMLICLPLQWANLRVNPLLLFTSRADLYLPPLPFLI